MGRIKFEAVIIDMGRDCVTSKGAQNRDMMKVTLLLPRNK